MDEAASLGATVWTGKFQLETIDADDFSEFCKRHGKEVVGRRLSVDRLNFVQSFVFPPSHAERLPVRESKKERVAYEDQVRKLPEFDLAEDEYGEDLAATA